MKNPHQPELASAAFQADPYPFYQHLRQHTPVAQVSLPGRRKAWLVTRYDDVVAALKDQRLVKDRRNLPDGQSGAGWMPALLRPLASNMLDLDPPDHTRLRALVHKGFTPRRIEQLRARIQQLCDDLLDRAQARGTFDVIADYALPIPLTIIAELLGVPPQDRGAFRRWSQNLVAVTTTVDMVRVLPGVWQTMRYLRGLVAQRRAAPEDDLVSALVQAESEGDRLSEDELLGMIFLLLLAGHETTVNLIGNSLLTLSQHPEQYQMLRQSPGIVKTAVEELARYASPVFLATERYAREPLTIADTDIPAGGLVLAALGSANRDEAHFAAADRLDLARDPNHHLAFGQGIHYCLGAPLARLETQLALTTLARRMPELRIARTGELHWRRGLFVRGLESLPLALA